MLHVLTYGAGNVSRFEYLKASASLCDLPIKYITEAAWTGFFGKLKCILKAIKSIPNDDIICVIDGFDVIVAGGPEEIISKFKAYDCDILFGAELNCWPGEYAEKYPNLGIKNGYKFVNGGGFIGYKWALMQMYTWKDISEVERICKAFTDQGYFIEYLTEYRHARKLKLDCCVEIFQNMFSVDWSEITIRNGRVVNLLTNTTPAIIHFNGDAWKTKAGGDIMPVFVDKLERSYNDSDKDYNLSGYEPNFSKWYFKRSQL